MATTWIKPIHANESHSKHQTITDTIDYAINPDKTEGGKHVTGYHCSPECSADEFMFSKDMYADITGREQGLNDILVYHVRQAFAPGEITPEEANMLGHELAMELTKGEHSFIVATHTDRNHIHNHIIINSTRLDFTGKYRNPLHSSKALRKISDAICEKNGLSIIEEPSFGSGTYSLATEAKKEPSKRQKLEFLIDEVMQKSKPKDLDELLKSLSFMNCKVKKRGKNVSLLLEGQERFLRLSSLSENYTEEVLCKRIVEQGNDVDVSFKNHSRIIDIDTRMSEIISIVENENIGLKRSSTINKLQEEYATLRAEKQYIESRGSTHPQNTIEGKIAFRDTEI